MHISGNNYTAEINKIIRNIAEELKINEANNNETTGSKFFLIAHLKKIIDTIGLN